MGCNLVSKIMTEWDLLDSPYQRKKKRKSEKIKLRNEFDNFFMCRERSIKVNGAPEVEERGHCGGRKSLP